MPDSALKATPEKGPATFRKWEPGGWFIQRQSNRWYSKEETRSHPYPGTYPSVISDGADWGGWRVSAAEYNRAPYRIEFQARLIAHAPELLDICRRLAAAADFSSGHAAGLTERDIEHVKDLLAAIGDPPETEQAGHDPAKAASGD